MLYFEELLLQVTNHNILDISNCDGVKLSSRYIFLKKASSPIELIKSNNPSFKNLDYNIMKCLFFKLQNYNILISCFSDTFMKSNSGN